MTGRLAVEIVDASREGGEGVETQSRGGKEVVVVVGRVVEKGTGEEILEAFERTLFSIGLEGEEEEEEEMREGSACGVEEEEEALVVDVGEPGREGGNSLADSPCLLRVNALERN